MIQSSHDGPNIGPVLISCTRSVLLGLCGLVLLVGFAFAAPFIVDGISFVWYGWARILTRDYTTVIPAVLLEWAALIVAVWAVCVTVKLERAKSGGGSLFGVVAVLLLVFAVLPANCALSAVMSDWKIPFSVGHTAMECAAGITVFLVLMACVLAPFGAFLAVMTSEESR
ncbi:hypothetical protein [Burkholderia ubonensis]|uniref:hypothetical protein n=1 Tax=Burkholderia ubonensis TaxID=101571 RepID=UPI00075954E6|nr:hypothetical protein [Burkholderia ubonensis]KWE97878.1 hypothetical protein WL81_02275 [Burkholderia ubonensis]